MTFTLEAWGSALLAVTPFAWAVLNLLKAKGVKNSRRVFLLLAFLAGVYSWFAIYRSCSNDAVFKYMSKEWAVPLGITRGELLYEGTSWLYGPLPPYLAVWMGQLTGEVGWRAYQFLCFALNLGSIAMLYILSSRIFRQRKNLAVFVTVFFASYILFSARGVRPQGSVYILEAFCYLVVLVLCFKRLGPIRLIGQGVFLGLGWLSKPFAPMALLTALALSEVFARRKFILRRRIFKALFWRSFLRVVGMLFVVGVAAGVLSRIGVSPERWRDALFPFYVRQMYVQGGMSFLKEFCEVYFSFGPGHTFGYFVLRSFFYVQLVLGAVSLAWLLFRGAALAPLVPVAKRVVTAAGLFWFISLGVIWGQWDNHVTFDVLLFLPSAVLIGYLLKTHARIARFILMTILVTLILSFRLEIGEFWKLGFCSTRSVGGVLVTDEAVQYLNQIKTVVSTRGEGATLVALGNAAAIYEITGRPRPWRIHNYLWGQERHWDLDVLARNTRDRDLLILDAGGIENLFGVERLDPDLLRSVPSDHRALYENWTTGIQRVGTIEGTGLPEQTIYQRKRVFSPSR